MKFLGMGGFEFVIILIVILLIFGPKNLPKLGQAFKKTAGSLKAGMEEGKKKPSDEDAADESAGDGEEGEAVASEDAAPSQEETEFSDGLSEEEAGAGISEAANDAVDEAEAAAQEAFEGTTRKVRRVVKKPTSGE